MKKKTKRYSRKLMVHAQNSKWNGPLCAYEASAYKRERAALISSKHSEVTCKACLRIIENRPCTNQAKKLFSLFRGKVSPEDQESVKRLYTSCEDI